jgi:hypothetical protein
LTTEGKVKVDDLILSGTGNIYRVNKVNTKHKAANKTLKGRRILTENI